MDSIILNINMPESWRTLSPRQLKDIFNVISLNYDAMQSLVLLCFRWNRIKLLCRCSDNSRVLKIGKDLYRVRPNVFAEALNNFQWLLMPPDTPVRPPEFRRRNALDPEFDGVPFQTFLMADNLYQGYLITASDKLLDSLCSILYPSPRFLPLSDYNPKWLKIAAFFWMNALKTSLARKYPNLFKSAPQDYNMLGTPSVNVEKSMNAQIRALTKGDVSKEKLILNIDTHRALAELDEQAREYLDFKTKYGN